MSHFSITSLKKEICVEKRESFEAIVDSFEGTQSLSSNDKKITQQNFLSRLSW